MKYLDDIYIYMIDSYMMVKTVLNILGFEFKSRLSTFQRFDSHAVMVSPVGVETSPRCP